MFNENGTEKTSMGDLLRAVSGKKKQEKAARETAEKVFLPGQHVPGPAPRGPLLYIER